MKIFMKERILTIDYGSKRIGLAVSDPLGLTAQPLPYLSNHGIQPFIQDLKKIIREKSVSRIVLGLPRSLDGTLGPKALEIQQLGEQIQKECSVKVDLYDESFTSKDAEDILIHELDVSRKKRKEIRDSLAACLILQRYMEQFRV